MAWPVRVLETTLDDTPESFQAFTRDFVSRSAPAVLRGACTTWPAFAQWSTAPDARGGLRRLALSARHVTVLVASALEGAEEENGGSGGGASSDAPGVVLFSGDPSVRESVSLDFGTLCDVAHASACASMATTTEQRLGTAEHHAALRDTPHPLVVESGLAFYLSQCPITGGASTRNSDNDEAYDGCLPELEEDVCVPAALREIATATNLWVGTTRSVSNTHFDASHNLLYIVRGAKHVWLSPPAAADGLAPHPVWKAGCFNHSTSSAHHHGAVDRASLTDAAGGGAADGSSAVASVGVNVIAGDALFIPEGWWHTVTSAPGTVAVNVWWPGCAAELAARAAEQSSPNVGVELYLARCALALAVDATRHRATDAACERAAATTDRVVVDDKSFAKLDDVGRRVWLRGAEWADHERLLPPFASRYPDDWERTLLGVDAVTAEVVVTTWERAGATPSFFASIMDEPLGEHRAARVKLSLRDARDEFARQAFEDVLRQMGRPSLALASDGAPASL
jgi:hypothetical protein